VWLWNRSEFTSATTTTQNGKKIASSMSLGRTAKREPYRISLALPWAVYVVPVRAYKPQGVTRRGGGAETLRTVNKQNLNGLQPLVFCLFKNKYRGRQLRRLVSFWPVHNSLYIRYEATCSLNQSCWSTYFCFFVIRWWSLGLFCLLLNGAFS